MIKNNLAVSVLILLAVLVVGYFLINKEVAAPVEETPVVEQGKIDITTVCLGALSYMTFPDAAAAEVFIQECIEGKHPEVIEDFKKQMNAGDGANI